METKTIFIGFDGEIVVDTKTTRQQIDAVRALECALEVANPDNPSEMQKCVWEMFDDPNEPLTAFQFILGDRKKRVDGHTLMADRPPIAVVTTLENKVVRLEFYEGHDILTLSYDLRSKELQGKDLPLWMDYDPMVYDPVKFLKEALGLPEELTRPLMKVLHPDTWEREHETD